MPTAKSGFNVARGKDVIPKARYEIDWRETKTLEV